MNRIAFASLTVVAAAFAVSCQKEEISEQKDFTPMTINAVSEGIGTATKAQMVYKYDVVWSESDKIHVTDGVSSDTFTISDGVGTIKGTFTQDGSVSFGNEVQAYYPASMAQGGSLVWPASQTVDQTMPMYCKKALSGSSAEDFSFSSLGAVIQIAFSTKSENVVLKTIKISDGSKKLSGAFTVDSEGKAVIESSGDNRITLDLGAGVAVGVAAKYFNIAIPAGDYKDLTLRFTAADGRMCVMHSTTFPSVERNTVGRLTLAGSFESAIQAVDLGLSVKWANVNLGADKPEDQGDYFAWGEAVSGKSSYSWRNYKFFNGVFSSSTGNYGVSKYCTDLQFGKVKDDKTVLDLEDDTANAVWGGSWQMPTKEQMDELMTKCSWSWATVNGKTGFRVSRNGNSIFLPVAGASSGSSDRGNYWTSTLNTANNNQAYYLFFGNGSNGPFYNSSKSYRENGLTIRPVLSNN